jgi:5-methyltetrahydropteroyltriglutamate--homocysteine methyltransferase
MRENRLSGSTSGMWKRSTVWLLGHRQTKGAATDRPHLHHRATSRLHRCKGAKIPEDKVLIPGCLSTTTNYIEHPELVAERLERFAQIVGRDRIMAGSDCGFGTFAGFGPVEPDIAYLKLKSLVEGAQIASRRLWAR